MTNIPKSATLPRNFRFWPEDAVNVGSKRIKDLYDQGYAGAFQDKTMTKEFEEFIVGQSFGNLDGEAVAEENDLAGTGEGRLVIPFVFIEQQLPGVFPGAAQQVGDCVSHSTKNACLLTLICDIVSGKPDEVTGKYEGLPDIDPEGIKQGGLSTEAIYWYRGYNGHGWQCEIAAKVACEKAALWPRKDYPELGVNFTKYSGSNASKYGKKAPAAEFTKAGQEHLIRTATRVKTFEGIRDYLANGYGISSCGSEGWASKRDENGFSRRSGSWAHAMAYIAADDRPEIHDKYGEGLVLIMNSWGRFNSGGRVILNTDIKIPEGSFWAKWSDCKNRSAIAFSGAAGWPTKSLPPIDLVVG